MIATGIAGHGWLTLLYKELLRFWKVAFQTLAAPILTALLYLLIFSHVLENRVAVFEGRHIATQDGYSIATFAEMADGFS